MEPTLRDAALCAGVEGVPREQRDELCLILELLVAAVEVD